MNQFFSTGKKDNYMPAQLVSLLLLTLLLLGAFYILHSGRQSLRQMENRG